MSMAEELQGLLDKIQKDGVAKADAASKTLVDEATSQAVAIVKAAEAKAAKLIADAEEDAKQFEQRARSSLQQAARDLVLTVGEAVNAALAKVVATHADAALTGEALGKIIEVAVATYAATGATVTLAQDQQAAVQDYFRAALSDAARGGIVLASDNGVVSGFTVKLDGDSVTNDFTGKAISAALGALLRPDLAAIVNEAAAQVQA
jgi:V/A-type H+-transporting ATPase subunit E